MICSGLCRRRFIVVSILLPHNGELDSHNGWINSRDGGHAKLPIGGQQNSPRTVT